MSGDVFLTQGLQCSAQCFAGASRDVAGRDVASRNVASGYSFFFKIVGLRKNKGVTLW